MFFLSLASNLLTRLDARHAARSVAQALLLLALAVLVRGALAQALLPQQRGLLLVARTFRRRRVARILVDATVVVRLLGGLFVLVPVVVVLVGGFGGL